jgi:sirohydrochlorin ferrochelatase
MSTNSNLTPTIVILGHGSREPTASRDMEKVAASIRKKHPGARVEVCSMSGAGPQLGETIDRCVADGARRILVIPYFLHVGIHLREDIPAMLREKLVQHPSVAITLGKNLGFDEALADLVWKRIEESKELEPIKAK